MKVKQLRFLGLMVCLISPNVVAQFVQGPADSLQADVVALVVATQAGQVPENISVTAELYITNDGNNVVSGSMGFSWDNPKLQLDSAVASPLTTSAFDFMIFLYDYGDRDSSNAHQRSLFAGARKTTAGVLAQPVKQLWATYYFTYINWSSGESFTIDKSEYTPGARHVLVDSLSRAWSPFWEGSTTIEFPLACCVGMTGNVDMDPNDVVDIADLTVLQDHLFGPNFPPLPCVDEANVDGVGSVDIADYTLLIDHLFINFPPLADCP